jgi:hypothetical protein
MKKIYCAVTVLSLILVFAAFSFAQAPETKTQPAKKPAQKPGGIVVEAVSGTATVDAVDKEKRMVTLKFADGKTQSLKLGPEVRNFDQIQVGDQVKATYAESVAIAVRKSDEKPSAAAVQTVQVAPKGEKPGVIVTDTTEVTAKVEAIDYTKRTVALKGPEGNVRTFSVDKSVKKFKNVKVGDEVVVRVTQAMAIVVEKAN